MTTCAVSVIIPLFNAEKYIRQCLISVLASEFKDYEVIVIDDCSTDNSVAEVEKLLPHFDGRLKIFSTEKNSGGAGVPRNVGIQNAAGKYITFVDNDDLILPTALGDFFDTAEEFQADVIYAERFIIFNDNDLKSAKPRLYSGLPNFKFVEKPTLEPEDLTERIQRYVGGKFLWVPWGKFYRRDFLIENRIEFPQVRFSEDMVFSFECLCLAKKYLRVPNVTNIYRARKNSAAGNYNLKTWLLVTTKVVSVMEDFMSKQEFFQRNAEVHHAVLQFVTGESFNWITKACSKDLPHEVYKIFYYCLQGSELDARGKDILLAYLCAEQATNQTR